VFRRTVQGTSPVQRSMLTPYEGTGGRRRQGNTTDNLAGVDRKLFQDGLPSAPRRGRRMPSGPKESDVLGAGEQVRRRGVVPGGGQGAVSFSLSGRTSLAPLCVNDWRQRVSGDIIQTCGCPQLWSIKERPQPRCPENGGRGKKSRRPGVGRMRGRQRRGTSQGLRSFISVDLPYSTDSSRNGRTRARKKRQALAWIGEGKEKRCPWGPTQRRVKKVTN